jgi:hypothetical protein
MEKAFIFCILKIKIIKVKFLGKGRSIKSQKIEIQKNTSKLQKQGRLD